MDKSTWTGLDHQDCKCQIENPIKFIKGNFLNNRPDVDDEILNRNCLKWLERTGNARDQFRLLQSLLDRFGEGQALDVISFCLVSNLCSVNTVRAFCGLSGRLFSRCFLSFSPQCSAGRRASYATES